VAQPSQKKPAKAAAKKPAAPKKPATITQSAIDIPQAKPTGSGLVFMVWLNTLLIVTLLGAGSYFIWPHLQSSHSTRSDARMRKVNDSFIKIKQQIQALDTRMNALTEYVDNSLSQTVQNLPESLPQEENLSSLESSLETIEGVTLATTEAKKTFQKPNEPIEDNSEIVAGLSEINDRTVMLEEKLYQLDQAVQQTQAKEQRSNSVLAVVQLKEAALSNKSFLHELAHLKEVLAQDNDPVAQQYIETLEPFAEAGIETFSALEKGFEATSTQITMLLRGQKDSPTFADELLLRLPKFIQVRKIEADHNSITDEDILARAYQFMEQKNLEDAVSEISTLYGKQGYIAQGWLDRANAYITVKRSLAALLTHLTSAPQALVRPNSP
jgi:hypothetical protein